MFPQHYLLTYGFPNLVTTERKLPTHEYHGLETRELKCKVACQSRYLKNKYQAGVNLICKDRDEYYSEYLHFIIMYKEKQRKCF